MQADEGLQIPDQPDQSTSLGTAIRAPRMPSSTAVRVRVIDAVRRKAQNKVVKAGLPEVLAQRPWAGRELLPFRF
jgi:hypothetical protein